MFAVSSFVLSDKNIFVTKWTILVVFLLFYFFTFDRTPAKASVIDGTIDSVNRYAWGENIGWIDFGSSTDAVHVTDSALTGAAYGENIGWLVLNPAGYGGVSNDALGNLSGYAWGENIGWVDFSKVVIGVDGVFSGQAYGENIGWITFGTTTNKVTTDWRPSSARQTFSGTLYQADGATPYATSTTITVAVATSSIATSTVATFSTTTEATTGNFDFNISIGQMATGSRLTFFTDNSASISAVTVTKTSGAQALNNLKLQKDYVTVANEGVGTTTNASDFIYYDKTDDSDVHFTASTSLGRLTVDDGFTLLVASGTTFKLDLPITVDDFKTNTGATVLASSTLTVGGDFTQNGTFVTAEASSSAWTARSAAGDNDDWYVITYGNGLFVAVGSGPDRVMTSPDGINWTAQSAAGDDDDWYAITYGNGLFVAVGSGPDRVMTSPDGINWTAQSAAGDDDDWSAITYGNGLFVAVGWGGDYVMTSPDGSAWATSSAAGNDDDWNAITYGNGLFVAVGDNGDRVMTSPDGINWTAQSAAGDDDSWRAITYGNGLFVAVGSYSNDLVMTSPDGINWTARSAAGDDDSWDAITYGNGLFVAVGIGADYVMTSLDSITWTTRSAAGNDNYWQAITYGSGVFVAVGDYGNDRVMTSPGVNTLTFNGTTTQTLSGTMVATSTLPNLLFQGSGSKTFSNNASTSDFFIVSTSGTVTGPTSLSITGNYENNSTFNAPTNLYFSGANQTATGTLTNLTNLNIIGTGEKTFYSNTTTTNLTVDSIFNAPAELTITGNYTNNGTSTYGSGLWTAQSAAGDDDGLFAITYGNGLFVAVGGYYSGDRVMTSPDGINWTARSAVGNDEDSWSAITYGNGLFVAVGSYYSVNRVMTSPDGINWTARSAAGDNDGWQAITYGNGLFVAVGIGVDRVMTSPDGINWTARSAAGNNDPWQAITYGNGLFVAVGGYYSDDRVMTSPDGINWTTRSAAGDDDDWSAITYGNGLFVAVGSGASGDHVMTSPDGITWTARSAVGNNDEWTDVTYGNGLFVAVGTGADHIMTSTDGINWTARSAVVNNNPWQAIAYTSGLFVAVGNGGYVITSTSWSTTTLAGASAQSLSGNLSGASAFGNLVLTGAGTKTFNNTTSAVDFNIMSTSSTVVAPSQLTILGNYENQGTFTAGSGTTTLNGQEKQTLSGNLTNTAGNNSAFKHLTLSGDGDKKPLAPLETTGNFTISSSTFLASSSLKVGGNFTQNGTFAKTDDAWTARSAAGDNDYWNAITYGNGLFVAVGRSGDRVMTSPDGINWTTRSAADNNDYWNAITYGNGLFVAVGQSGDLVITSPDGINWTAQSAAGDDDSWSAITYGNGLFVAVGSYSNDLVMTSPDGITWTAQSAAGDDDVWRNITYGNSLFVAVSEYGDRVMTSPDGINWTTRSAAGDNDSWYGITYGNGLFVAVGQYGDRVMTSPDGITWTARSAAGNDDNWFGITYGNGLFVAVGYPGDRVMTSPDGITWTARSAAGDNDDWRAITHGNGLFVAVGQSGDHVITSNGSFTLTLSGPSAQTLSGTLTGTSTLPSLIFQGTGTKTFNNNASSTDFTIVNTSGIVTAPANLSIGGNYTNEGTFNTPTNNLYFSGSQQTATGTMSNLNNLIITGTEAKSFNTNFTTTNLTVNSTFNAPSELTITGNYENNGTSTYGGGEWTARSAAGNDDQWSAITYGNGLFVAVGRSGDRVMTSPDGITWTARSAAGDNDSWRGITYGNGLFVAVGSFGDRVMTSPDSITWTARSAAGNNDSWNAITYGNGLFVAVGDYGDRVMTSPDGITWTTRSAAGNNDDWNAVTYGNGLFVAVGRSGDRVMTSPDGITWTARSAAGDNDSWYTITYGNGLFVAVGQYGDRVMTSPDGINWTARSTALDNDSWYSITYGNNLFVAVGQSGDRVMTSPDGINWTTRSAADNNDYWNAITYGNGLFVAVGIGTDRVMTSSGWGTTTLGGASAQTLSGNMTGASALGNVVVSGSATTTFSGALMVANDLTMKAGSKLALADGATTTIKGDLYLYGTSSAPVLLVSKTPGQTANFVLLGSSTVRHTRLKDSNACGSVGGSINVGGHGNVDEGNLNCWDFTVLKPYLSMSEDYQFYVGQATTSLSGLTITDADTPTITATNDIRITIATTTTDFRFDTSVTNLEFTGSASGKVSNTVSYEDNGATLKINVTSNFAATDTIAIKDNTPIMVGSFASVSTTTSHLKLNVDGNSAGEIAKTDETIRITGKLTIANHSAGQVTNKFRFLSLNKTEDAPVFAFNLNASGETIKVSDLVLDLSDLVEFSDDNLQDLRLYRDNNSDGVVDGGDDLVDGNGILTINGPVGAITFSNDFVATTSSSTNYIVTADVRAESSGSMALSLETIGITPLGMTSQFIPVIENTVSVARHYRYLSSGGGSSARIGDDAPPGDGVVGGGGEGGGGGADAPGDGENIAPDPNFFRPTTTGTPDNDWTNGSNTYISDGVYATASTSAFKQSYNGFGFGLPVTDTIQGIAVKLDLSGSTAAGSVDVSLSWDNGSSYTTAKATPTVTGSDVIYTVGGEADTWGRSWTVNDFASANFLLRVSATPSSNTLRLDAIEVRVFHQASGGGSGGGGGI